MKRNMDLVREILIHIEENGYLNGDNQGSLGEKYGALLWAHTAMMENGKILEYSNAHVLNDDRLKSATAFRMTWTGYDFLETIRDDGTWSKLKKLCEENKSGLSINTILETATFILRKALSGL